MSAHQHQQFLDIPDKLVDVFEGSAAPEPGGLNVRGSYGGRGSAKTRTFALMTAVMAYKWSRQGIRGVIMCGREVGNDTDDSVKAEVLEALEAHPWLKAHFDVSKAGEIETKDGRIKFIFQGLSAKTIKGVKSTARLLLVWIEEAETISEVVWRTIIPTFRSDDAAELWLTWNPEEERAATNQRFRVRPPRGAKIVEMNWRDNPFFPKVLDITRRSDQELFPDTYEHIWEGDYLDVTEGAFFNMAMRKAKADGRICSIPIESHLPTFSFWDLGMSDDMAIWIMQVLGKELRMVGYHSDNGHELGHYIDWIEDFTKEHNIRAWHTHFGPHDVNVRELQTGKTRQEWAKDERDFVFQRVDRVPTKQLSIDATRRILPRVWFDKHRCEDGIAAMKGYRRKFMKDLNRFAKEPLHNWASNGADAFQQLGLVWDDKLVTKRDAEAEMEEYLSSRGR